MRNCLEFPKPLYFGRETGLNFGATVQFAALWIVVIQNPQIVRFHFPRFFSFGVLLFGPEFWSGDSCQSELFSCSFISSISLYACSWLANFSFSFCSCCIFC
jgi:hypothetical protein